jgi:hypothetical protein
MSGGLDDLDPAAQREVEARLAEIMASVRRKDVDRLEQMHRWGPKFSKFDDCDPLGRQDAETCKRLEREGLLSLVEVEFSFKDLKIDVFGPVAIATFILDEHMKTETDTIACQARSTMVFVREPAGWMITHEHFSSFKANP